MGAGMGLRGVVGLVMVALILTELPAGLADAAVRGASPPTEEPRQYPTEMPAIGVQVSQDGLDAQGHWSQTVQLTIQSGGTLADASLVVYGDTDHVDQLFAAAQKKNPSLAAPAMIPAGQVIEITIDPSAVFALQAVLHTTDTIVQRFTNGTVNTIYLHPNGSLTRAIDFSDGKPTDLFDYPTNGGPLKVRPGGRIAELTYAKGQSFSDIVSQAYGLTNFAAAADLTDQTGWDPTHWPPPIGESKQVIIGPRSMFSERPSAVDPIPNPDPTGRAQQLQLDRRRRQIGVYPVRLESFGTVYHVAVSDPSITASQFSKLIYGTAQHRDDIARTAGFQVPEENAAKTTGAFDPHLFGRSFELAVDYVNEDFVVRRETDATGITTVELADGAWLTTYPTAEAGPMQVVRYPTGYKRIRYRPPTLFLTVAQGLALLYTARDLGLATDTVETMGREYAAEVIWHWAPGIPRTSTDIADTLDLVDSPAGPYLEALIAPPAPHTIVDQVIDVLRLRDPLAAIASLVLLSTIILLLASLIRRSVGQRQRVRW